MTKSESFLTGVSDYYFKDTKKDRRSAPPKWMTFKLHIKEWNEGWLFAKQQEL